MEHITSKGNARIMRVSWLLSDKTERDASGLFVAEGARLCLDAAESGVKIVEAYITGAALSKYHEARVILEKAEEAFEISDEVAAKISDTKTPQGIFAVCGKPLWEKPVRIAQNARYLLLSSLQNPGNVGTIIRTAEAFGLNGVVLSSDCPDVYSPKVLRATMGGAFRLRTWTADDMQSEIAAMKEKGASVYAAALGTDAHMLGGFKFKGACAVVLGNEGAGLDAGLISVCDGVVTIPMAGRADSLGVAMAAGIIAWEMTK